MFKLGRGAGCGREFEGEWREVYPSLEGVSTVGVPMSPVLRVATSAG